MNQKILFVDDEPAALDCYTRMLQSDSTLQPRPAVKTARQRSAMTVLLRLFFPTYRCLAWMECNS